MSQPDLHRIRALAGLTEAPLDVLNPDEALDQDDREDDERRAREHKVEGLIGAVFQKLGIGVEHISYEEASGREAEVVLDDFEQDLAKLAAVVSTGLSSNYTVKARNYVLAVSFVVAEGLENASMTRR